MIRRFFLVVLLSAGLHSAAAAQIWLGGSPDSPFGLGLNMRIHFFGGETAVIQGKFKGETDRIVFDGKSVNEASIELIFSVDKRVLARSSTTAKLPTDGWATFEAVLNFPETRRLIQGDLRVRSNIPSLGSLGVRVAVFPKGAMHDMERITKNKRIGIVDPAGALAAHLSDRRVRFETLSTRTAMRAFDGDLVIVNAARLGGKRDSLLSLFNAGVRRGLTVMILEPENIPPDFRNGMELHPVPSRAARDGDGSFFDTHFLISGLGRPPLGNWLSHWRPDGFVATSAVSVPVEGNARILAAPIESAETLAVIIEIPEDKGLHVFSTLRTSARDGDPVPPLILDNLVLHYLHRDTESWRHAALLVDTSTEKAREFFESIGAYAGSIPDFEETCPLWIFDGAGDHLKSFRVADPNFWFRFFKRVAAGGETAVFLNVDAGGWDLVSEYVRDAKLNIESLEQEEDTFEIPKPARSFLSNISPADLRSYTIRNPSAALTMLTDMDFLKTAWTTAPPIIARLPHGNGEIFLVQLDWPEGNIAASRRLWARFLTAWNVEIQPTDRSKNKNFQE